MKSIGKRVISLLVLCAALLLAVPACTSEYILGSTPLKAEESQSQREQTAAPVPAAAEKTAQSPESKDWLPSMGCVGGLVSLMAAAFWCAAKNQQRRKSPT